MQDIFEIIVTSTQVLGCGQLRFSKRLTQPVSVVWNKQREDLMAKMFGSKTLSISIDCHPAKVYEFVSNPENLPKWATAFCKSVRKSGNDWIMETPRRIDESQVCKKQ
jgi:hypothetical protein